MGRDVAQAVGLFQLVVAGGSCVAHVRLEHCYNCGNGIEKSIEEVLRLYQLAAQNYDDSGITALASLHKFGKGVPRDEEQAVYLYRRAA